MSFRTILCIRTAPKLLPALTVAMGLLLAACGSSGSGSPLCNNNRIEGAERCDGRDLGGVTCELLGFGVGIIACRTDCAGFDLSQCGTPSSCNDNTKNGPEVCDGQDLGGATCQTLGYSGGTLACMANCGGYITSGCGSPLSCNNGVKNAGEACDGVDFGGVTCQTYGFDKGSLACQADCMAIITSGCENNQTCVPDCADRACGPDPVCGQSCGSCPDDWSCQSGTCKEPCDLDPFTANTPLDFNLVTVSVAGTITVNGLPMAGNTQTDYQDYKRGELWFIRQDTASVQSVDLPASGPGTYHLTLFAGVYDIVLAAKDAEYQNVLPDQRITLERGRLINQGVTLDYDVRTVTVAGSVTLNNLRMPDNTHPDYAESNRGYLRFISTDRGDVLQQELGAGGPASYSVVLFAGVYHVDLAPAEDDYQNVLPYCQARIRQDLSLTASQPMDFNVNTVDVAGSVALNGGPMPGNTLPDYETSDRATLRFRRADTSDYLSVTLGANGPASFQARLFTGAYRVELHPQDRSYQNVLPDVTVVLQNNLELTQNTPLSFNLQTVIVAGVVTLNNNPMPGNTRQGYETSDRAMLRFTRTDSLDYYDIDLGASGPAAYEVVLPVGEYDVLVVPNNDYYQDVLPTLAVQVAAKRLFNVDQPWEIPLKTVQVGGVVTRNSLPMPKNTRSGYQESDRAFLRFVRTDTQTLIDEPLGYEGPATYNVTIFEGQYDILLAPAGEYYQNVLPDYSIRLSDDRSFTANTPLDFDVATIEVGGSVTLNNLPMPGNTHPDYSSNNRAALRFQRLDTFQGEQLDLGANGPASYSTTLFTGSYDVLLYPVDPSYQNVLPSARARLRHGCTKKQ